MLNPIFPRGPQKEIFIIMFKLCFSINIVRKWLTDECVINDCVMPNLDLLGNVDSDWQCFIFHQLKKEKMILESIESNEIIPQFCYACGVDIPIWIELEQLLQLHCRCFCHSRRPWYEQPFTLNSSYSFYQVQGNGNQAHGLDVASIMLYCLSFFPLVLVFDSTKPHRLSLCGKVQHKNMSKHLFFVIFEIKSTGWERDEGE